MSGRRQVTPWPPEDCRYLRLRPAPLAAKLSAVRHDGQFILQERAALLQAGGRGTARWQQRQNPSGLCAAGVSKRREPFVYYYAGCAVTDSRSGGWDWRKGYGTVVGKAAPQRIVRRWGVQREGTLCLLLRRIRGHRFTQPGLGSAEGGRHGSDKEFTPADCAPLGCPKGGEPFVYCYAECAAIDSRKWAGPAEHSTDGS